MKFNAKKEAKKLIDSLKFEIAETSERIRKERRSDNRDSEYLISQRQKLEELEKLVKSKDILLAFKVLSSENPKKISQYLETEFSKLSERAKKIIFHHTTELTADGKSVYEGSDVNVWDMYKDIPFDMIGMATTSIENLFKSKFMPKAVSDLFPTYTRLKENDYAVNPQHLFEDITKLAEITYTPEDRPETEEQYISNNCFKRLIDTYFSKQGWLTYADDVYTTDRLTEFYNQLEQTVSNSPNLQKSGLLNELPIYTRFLTGKFAYQNYLELTKHPEIKSKFYEGSNTTGVNTFLRMLYNLPEQERLKCIAEYVADPQYQPESKSNNLIVEYLQRHIKDKSLLVDFDTTFPIFEKLAFSEYPIAYCFANEQFNMDLFSSLKRIEDDILGIDREKLPFKVSFDMSKENLDKFKSAILDYHTYGLIDEKTYDDVLAIGQKFNKNLTIEKLKEVIAKNDNLKAVMEYLTQCSRQSFRPHNIDPKYPQDCLSPYSRALYDLETIFPKTRLQSLPELEAFKKMSLDQKAKFNIKVWNQFAVLPLFSKDANTKRALVEFIAVMGLFEDDANVEKRRQAALKIATDYGEKFSLTEDPRFLERLQVALFKPHGPYDLPSELKTDIPDPYAVMDYIKEKYLQPCKIKRFIIRDNVDIPQDLQGYFVTQNAVGERYLAELKKMTGSFGKKMGNFLSPYAKEGDVYKLKKDVIIPPEIADFIKDEMSTEEYEEILKLAELDGEEIFEKMVGQSNLLKSAAQNLALFVKIKQIANFLNPIREVQVDGFMPRQDLSKADREIIQNVILSSTLFTGRLNFASVHRMFDGCKQEFDEEFYELLTKNFGLLLDAEGHQSQVKNVQASLQTAKKYYMARGNSNPTFLDVLTYLDRTPFTYGFGMDEFAQEVKNSGVKTQETYDFYQALLPKLESRKLTTIPRHQKTYVYTDKTGKKYTIMTKILRLDDPATMLVGESKFTNCCQVYHNAGQACMEHAATSKDGGIFATYLINDQGVPEMLTQSWIWTRESKLCLDNVEATDIITGKRGEERRLYQDIATYGIMEASKDLIETSRMGVDAYIAERTAEINRSTTLTAQQKKQQLAALEEFRQRQTLKIITVGEGCDDLNVAETFKEREKTELSQGPKGYTGYRDSGLLGSDDSKQHIIIKTTDEILPVDEHYEDVAFYRDERRISIKKGEKIAHSTLKHITEIEKAAHKEKMVNYTDQEGSVLTDPVKLAEIYGCRASDISVLAGEDWYYVYSDNGTDIEIYDFARREPRLEDELKNQQQEMALAFNTILSQSIVVKDGKVVKLKGIKAELREDTSYLLYLFQKHKGIIEQAGDDVRYKYEESDKKQVLTEEDQMEIMKNMRQIRTSGNQDMYMHKVSFVATEKTIEKAIDNSLSTIQERSL